MKKKYKCVSLERHSSDLEEEINWYAEKGWVLVSVEREGVKWVLFLEKDVGDP